jgi:23S rRNA pseudouridine955/2504/2580 synthase
MNKFIATKNDEGRTILKFINSFFNDVPYSRIEKTFRNKDIKINNKRIKNKKIILKCGDIIEIYGLKLVKSHKINSIKINFKIIFEDKNILIINKPQNIIVHGEKNSINNQVLSYLKFEKKDSFTPSHIGRLDKVTSGIMVYAKNFKSLLELNNKRQFFEKYYKAISNLKKNLILKAYIFHDEKLKKEIVNLNKMGKKCQTQFITQENNLIIIKLFTGRKHQIRSSLEFLKFPIKGDTKYGGKSAKRVYLHSYKIIFNNLENDLKYLNNKIFISEPNFDIS